MKWAHDRSSEAHGNVRQIFGSLQNEIKPKNFISDRNTIFLVRQVRLSGTFVMLRRTIKTWRETNPCTRSSKLGHKFCDLELKSAVSNIHSFASYIDQS